MAFISNHQKNCWFELVTFWVISVKVVLPCSFLSNVFSSVSRSLVVLWSVGSAKTWFVGLLLFSNCIAVISPSCFLVFRWSWEGCLCRILNCALFGYAAAIGSSAFCLLVVCTVFVFFLCQVVECYLSSLRNLVTRSSSAVLFV